MAIEVLENDLKDDNFDSSTLLCLAGSDKEDGTPITTTESLRRHLPFRFFGKLKHLEPDSTLFSVSLLNDPRNFLDFHFKFNNYYQQYFADNEVEEVIFFNFVKNLKKNQHSIFKKEKLHGP